jgi:hypothetical protein
VDRNSEYIGATWPDLTPEQEARLRRNDMMVEAAAWAISIGLFALAGWLWGVLS